MKSIPTRSKYNWQAVLAALFGIGLLAGCNDSSNGSSDDDDNGTGASNGGDNGGPVTEVTDADSVLVYEETDFHSGERQLLVVDTDDPNARSEVTPIAQDNLRARDETSPVWIYSAQSFTNPDETNVPLGVLGGDFSNGELTNASYQYTVYNTPDGELFRLDAASGDTTAERFSSEDDASVICAAFVAPDLADIDNSRLVYQVAKDTSCEDTEIRMARIGDDDSGEVVTLHDDVTVDDSFQTIQFAEMGGWLYDSDGALVEVISFDGDDILAYDLSGDSSTELETDSNHFAVLGYTDNGGAIVFAGNSGEVRTYSAGDSVENLSVSGSEWSVAYNLDSSHGVHANGNLYMVDPSSNSVIEIDGTDATVIDPGWASSSMPRAVTVADGYLAFAYQPSSAVWNIRQVALDASSATDLVNDIRANFPITSPKAPGSNGSYWLLYTDFGEEGDDPVARGVEFTGTGGEFGIDDALWRGETWSRTVGEIGYQAEYVLYQESDQEGDLFSLDASDPANSSGQNMQIGDLTWGIWVSGFGPVTLMVGREDQTLQTNRPEVLHIDASEAGSAVRITDAAVDHRPVPFY